jgi:hypothetical protein
VSVSLCRRAVAAAALAAVISPLSWALVARPAGAVPAPAQVVPCPPVVGCDPAGHLAGDAAESAAQAAFDVMGRWIASGAVTVLGRVADLITSTTSVNLDTPDGAATWFSQQYTWMRTLAVFVVLPMLLIAAISAIVHQDPSRLLRAVLVHLPLAVLGTAVAVELTDRALHLTDLLCAQVSASLGGNVRQALDSVGQAMSGLGIAGASAGGFVATIGTLLVAFGALLIWIELLIRASAIDVAVLFLPLALAGLLWPATARWARRMVELLAALILSKFVIVAVISLAAGALANGKGLDAVLAGAALLLTAAFAPFVLLRLVPMAEAGVINHLEGLERRPLTAAGGGAVRLAGLAMAGPLGDGGFSSSAAGFAPEAPLATAAGAPLPDLPVGASDDGGPPGGDDTGGSRPRPATLPDRGGDGALPAGDDGASPGES